jgi:quercetin dioxygenase-like cupin family protein
MPDHTVSEALRYRRTFTDENPVAITPMRENSMTKTIALALSLATAAFICSSAIAQDAKPELLVQDVVAGMPKFDQQEIKVFSATIQPGQKTPFHTHQYPVAVYILEGAFTLEMEGRPPLVKKAGEAFTEPPNVKMTGYNRGTEPTKVVIFYVSGPGEPFLHLAH